MNTFLKLGLNGFLAILLCTSCGGPGSGNDANGADSTAVKEAPVLPPSGVESDQIFKTTGEVIVYFYPDKVRLAELKKTNKNIEKELEDFRLFIANTKAIAEQKSRLVMESDENDIKLTVTEDQVNFINALGVKAGYGVVFARHKKKPLVIQGAVSVEEFKNQLEEYYK